MVVTGRGDELVGRTTPLPLPVVAIAFVVSKVASAWSTPEISELAG